MSLDGTSPGIILHTGYTSSSRCYLLELPKELRLEILMHAIGSVKPFTTDLAQCRSHPTFEPRYARFANSTVLHLCTLLRHDALSTVGKAMEQVLEDLRMQYDQKRNTRRELTVVWSPTSSQRAYDLAQEMFRIDWCVAVAVKVRKEWQTLCVDMGIRGDGRAKNETVSTS
ncbi:hypothetical protein B0A48_11136 [Cryoendolithus antarcticus]|uniref:Uncharacterized protein n=1 Tax=Cryoendolithus antarcticus TaxID=1507870 RepID=A0A1V8SUL2_9PEZI|nr:hypothetical protein B0A48_11136 [Cryoendolithus antarcticus]